MYPKQYVRVLRVLQTTAAILRTVTEKKRVIHDPAISLFINQFLNVVSLLKAIFIYFWNVN